MSLSTAQLSNKEILLRARAAFPELSPSRRRLLNFLAVEHKATAGRICSTCAIGNLSDVVIKMQPTLRKHGLLIRNYAPDKPLSNSFGEPSQVHFWELVVLGG